MTIEGRSWVPRACWRQSTSSLLAPAGRLVDHLTEGDAFDHVEEDCLTRHFRDDRQRMRIPLDQLLALLDLALVLHQDLSAVRHLVTRLFATVLVMQHQLGITRKRDRALLAVHHQIGIDQIHGAIDGALDHGALRLLLGGTTDMEGAHGQLRAGLTDRLRGDHTNRLTRD